MKNAYQTTKPERIKGPNKIYGHHDMTHRFRTRFRYLVVLIRLRCPLREGVVQRGHVLPRNSWVARSSAHELEVLMVRRWLREGTNCRLREGANSLFGCGCARAPTLVRMFVRIWLREGVNSCSDAVARGRQLVAARRCQLCLDVVARGRQLSFGCRCARAQTVFIYLLNRSLT